MSTGEHQGSEERGRLELRSAHGRRLELSLQVLLLKSLKLPWLWAWFTWGPTALCCPPIFESLKSLSPLELFYNSPQPFTEFERVSIPCRPKSLMKIVQIKSCLASEILITCPSTPMLIQPPRPTTPQQGPSTSEISTLLTHRCLAVSPISILLLTLLPQMHSLLFTLHPPGGLS